MRPEIFVNLQMISGSELMIRPGSEKDPNPKSTDLQSIALFARLLGATPAGRDLALSANGCVYRRPVLDADLFEREGSRGETVTLALTAIRIHRPDKPGFATLV